MPHYSLTLDNRSILGIIRRVCTYIDPRLIDHGLRVAWLTSRLLALKGTVYTPAQRRDICMLAVLHDVGAYKTEEIDQMVQFETGRVWAHAIYGSLFLKHFSPFQYLSDLVLYHHANWSLLESLDIDPSHKELAQFILVADRADIFFNQQSTEPDRFFSVMEEGRGTQYAPQVLDLLHQVEVFTPTPAELESDPLLYDMVCTPPFSTEDTDAIFKMLIYAIDFRSRHTVTHTMTTVIVSQSISRLLGMDEEDVALVVNSSLLHDLGKVSIPVEILEFPGKLSPQAMAIMRTHVDMTGDILGDCVTEKLRQVVIRHHEKLDGSGYPLGLTAETLSLPDRVVAVADIFSALCGARSYKTAFPKAKVLGILNQMGADRLIDSNIVSLINTHFDQIADEVQSCTAPLLKAYHTIAEEYTNLSNTYYD